MEKTLLTESEKARQLKKMGERLRMARNARSLSQIDIAEAMGGVSRAFVSLIENGQSGVDNEKLLRAAEVLNVEIDWLLWGKGKAPEFKPSPTIRKALRPATDVAHLSWSDDIKRPPFEGAVPIMDERIGSGEDYIEGEARVRDWVRLPVFMLEGSGITTDTRKLRIWEVGASKLPEVPRHSFAVVDTDQTTPISNEIFAIDNGTSFTIWKAIEQVGEPTKIGLSDGTRTNSLQIVPLRKIKICGKVVAVFRRL
jgi:transcriptional regulator with XRE-family HTH domain